MSKRKKQSKAKIVTKPAQPAATAKPVTKAKPRKTARPAAARSSSVPARPLTFGPETYKWLGIGFVLCIVGLLLMSGARPEDPNLFEEDYLYSFRRITLAPIVILSGIGVTIYALFKK